MNIEKLLADKLSLRQIKKAAEWVCEYHGNFDRLMDMARSADRRTSVNALWVIAHLPDSESERVASVRDMLTDMLISETDAARKRLFLKILREQDYNECIRTDFLDYCMSKINSECEPYAVRCFSMYAAFRMCRHYPELVAELEQHLDMMQYQELSPGLKSALRRTRKDIARLYRLRKRP